MPLSLHRREDELFAFQAVFGIAEGGVVVGRTDQPREHGGIGESEFGRLFSEIEFRRRFQPETAVPEIDGIEVFFEDLVLGIFLFQSPGQLVFAEFSLQGLFLGEVGVFDVLLGDGGSALLKRAGA